MAKLNNWFIKVGIGKCWFYSEGDRNSLNYFHGGCDFLDKECGLGFGWGKPRADGYYLHGGDCGDKRGLGYNIMSYAGSKDGRGCS